MQLEKLDKLVSGLLDEEQAKKLIKNNPEYLINQKMLLEALRPNKNVELRKKFISYIKKQVKKYRAVNCRSFLAQNGTTFIDEDEIQILHSKYASNKPFDVIKNQVDFSVQFAIWQQSTDAYKSNVGDLRYLFQLIKDRAQVINKLLCKVAELSNFRLSSINIDQPHDMLQSIFMMNQDAKAIALNANSQHTSITEKINKQMEDGSEQEYNENYNACFTVDEIKKLNTESRRNPIWEQAALYQKLERLATTSNSLLPPEKKGRKNHNVKSVFIQSMAGVFQSLTGKTAKDEFRPQKAHGIVKGEFAHFLCDIAKGIKDSVIKSKDLKSFIEGLESESGNSDLQAPCSVDQSISIAVTNALK